LKGPFGKGGEETSGCKKKLAAELYHWPRAANIHKRQKKEEAAENTIRGDWQTSVQNRELQGIKKEAKRKSDTFSRANGVM